MGMTRFDLTKLYRRLSKHLRVFGKPKEVGGDTDPDRKRPRARSGHPTPLPLGPLGGGDRRAAGPVRQERANALTVSSSRGWNGGATAAGPRET
jgi:hypothetical protein